MAELLPNPRRALRWRAPANLRAPFGPGRARWITAYRGIAGAEVVKITDDDRQTTLTGQEFDLVNIVAAPASGTTTTLIGSGAAKAFGPVPAGYRGVLLGIFPYLEGGAGPVAQARITGAGVTIRWRLLIDGQPRDPYHSITTILQPWGGPLSTNPLLEIRQKQVLSCDVTNTDAGGLYSYLGIRLVVRWIPWKKEWR